jgi:hypothetical protein
MENVFRLFIFLWCSLFYLHVAEVITNTRCARIVDDGFG